MAQIEKEFEEENQTYVGLPGEVREGWKMAKETHDREINKALSMIHELQAKLKVVSH